MGLDLKDGYMVLEILVSNSGGSMGKARWLSICDNIRNFCESGFEGSKRNVGGQRVLSKLRLGAPGGGFIQIEQQASNESTYSS